MLQRMARRLGRLPDGVKDAEIDHGLLMDLDLHQWVDMCAYFDLMDPEIKRAIDDFVHEGDATLDVRANIGQYSLLMAHRVGPRGRVDSFEPNPAVCHRLQSNVSKNQLDEVIHIHMAALADRVGVPDLYTYEGHAGLSSIAPYPERSYTAVETAVHTIDALLDGDHIGRPTFIKIDVEGAELLVLEGAEKVVALVRPVIVTEVGHYQTEHFGYSAQDIWQWANAHDYEYVLMDPLKGYRPIDRKSGVHRLAGEKHGNTLLQPR